MRNSSFSGFQTVYKINEEFLIYFVEKKSPVFARKTWIKLEQWAVRRSKSDWLPRKLLGNMSFYNKIFPNYENNHHFFLARLRRDQFLWFRKEYSENMNILRDLRKLDFFFLQNKWGFCLQKKWGFWEFKKWGIRKPKKKVWFAPIMAQFTYWTGPLSGRGFRKW